MVFSLFYGLVVKGFLKIQRWSQSKCLILFYLVCANLWSLFVLRLYYKADYFRESEDVVVFWLSMGLGGSVQVALSVLKAKVRPLQFLLHLPFEICQHSLVE